MLTPEQLTKMPRDEILDYFSNNQISKNEIMKVLSELGIAPSRKVSIKLSEFAANEISELGMYQRVSRGRRYKMEDNQELWEDIVDRLRAQGWSRIDAENEADARIDARRLARELKEKKDKE